MSEDTKLLRRLERALGRPLSAEECEQFEKLWPEVDRIMAELKSETQARLAAHQASPLVAFMRKLMARQGTNMSDFDTLYKQKAELDGKLLDGPHDPRP